MKVFWKMMRKRAFSFIKIPITFSVSKERFWKHQQLFKPNLILFLSPKLMPKFIKLLNPFTTPLVVPRLTPSWGMEDEFCLVESSFLARSGTTEILTGTTRLTSLCVGVSGDFIESLISVGWTRLPVFFINNGESLKSFSFSSKMFFLNSRLR